MKPNILLVLVPLLLVTGCAMYPNGEVPPAKTQAKKTPVKPATPQTAPSPNAAQMPKKPTYGPSTFAIDSGTSSFKAEPTSPAFNAQPLTLPSGTAAPVVPQVTPAVPAHTPELIPETQPSVPTTPQSSLVKPLAPSAPVVEPPALGIVTEDANIPAGTSPAILALLTEADRNRNNGDLAGAVVVTERALRIDSRNPVLTYKLAQLRMKQAKPQLAEELAGKAALLAGNNLDLKRKSWLLIAEARQKQNNYSAAKEAKAKADSFSVH